ncbi:MAG: hypothetical protein IT206_02185 [Fimbriimonadaceae bacterium]|nr:hypothetical protein [Fimbriimonadaceae bacterium]
MPGLGPVIAANPLTFISGCLMFVALAVWGVAIVHWMIGGEVEAWLGVLALGIGVVLCYVAQAPPEPWVSPVIVACLVITPALIPFIRRSLDERELKQMELDRMEKLISAILRQPDSTISRMEVARILVQFGYLANAIGIAELIKSAPLRQMDAEKREIKRWEFMLNDQNSSVIPCLRCGNAGHASALVCPHCQANYLVLYLRGRIVGPALARKLLVGWLLGVGLLLAIPLAATTLPPAGSLLIIPMMLALGGYTAYRTFFAPALNT